MRYDEYIDSQIPWIGQIPKQWSIKRNKNVFSCDKNIVGTNSSTTQLLSLTTNGIKKKNIDDTGGKVPESYDTYQIVKQNDIVMCLFDLDCSAVFSGLSKFEGMISPAYKVIRCNESMLPAFADYWFRSVFVGRKFKYLAKNIRYSLTYEDFSSLEIPCPALDEQRRIVDFLDFVCQKVDFIIEEAKASIEEYKAWKASIIYESVTKGLDSKAEMKDTNIEWIGKIPVTWQIRKIKNVASTGSGGTPKSDVREYYDGGINWVCSLDLHEQGITETKNTLSEYGLKNCASEIRPIGTVVMAMYGGSGTIGNSGILRTPCATNQAICCIMFGENVMPDYGFYYIRAIRSHWMIYAVGTRKDPNISQAIVSEMPIVLPPLKEQGCIIKYLNEHISNIDALIREKENLVSDLESYKKSLIFEVVTGKRKV